ncbi:MAG: LPS assembly lipoprotein LptE [Candidatus Cloacimonas sp.]|nr:LPS assembly lipoprotein LptE [Candidatus Cloacimonadota bacterium]
MKKLYINGLLIAIIFLTGCSYSVRLNQLPHLRDVAISPFENETLELYLEEELRTSLITSFRQDGRLRITYDNPDSKIEGKLIEYSNTIYGYDIDKNIEEYQVRLQMSLIFTDLVRNEVIYENKALSLVEYYSPSSVESVRLKSEEEAVKEIFKELFQVIVRNSLEAW